MSMSLFVCPSNLYSVSFIYESSIPFIDSFHITIVIMLRTEPEKCIE